LITAGRCSRRLDFTSPAFALRPARIRYE